MYFIRFRGAALSTSANTSLKGGVFLGSGRECTPATVQNSIGTSCMDVGVLRQEEEEEEEGEREREKPVALPSKKFYTACSLVTLGFRQFWKQNEIEVITWSGLGAEFIFYIVNHMNVQLWLFLETELLMC